MFCFWGKIVNIKRHMSSINSVKFRVWIYGIKETMVHKKGREEERSVLQRCGEDDHHEADRDGLRRRTRKRQKPRKAVAQTNAERQCQHCADPLAATAYCNPPVLICWRSVGLRERGRRRGTEWRKKSYEEEKWKGKKKNIPRTGSPVRGGREVWKLQSGGGGGRPQGWASQGRHKQQHQAKRKFAV